MEIDLRPYGLSWVLKDSWPAKYSMATVEFERLYKKMVFTKPNGDKSTFYRDKRIGKGSYGKVYSTFSDAGEHYIVKIIDKEKINKENFIKEVIVQIIVAEITKDITFPEISGPFTAKVYLVGENDLSYYLITEKLDINLLKEYNHGNLSDPKIVDYTVQLTRILSVLYEKLSFNHRDLKMDNIMIKYIDGKAQIRLIDFGFSCLKFGKLEISLTNRPFRYCFSRGRDLHSLFYNFLNSYEPIVDPDLDRILQFLTFSDKEEALNWGNTYGLYNTQDNPENLDVSVVFNIFKHLSPKLVNDRYTVNRDWTKYIVKIYPGAENILLDEEIVNIPLSLLRILLHQQTDFNLASRLANNQNNTDVLNLCNEVLSFKPILDLTAPDVTIKNGVGQNVLHYLAANVNMRILERILQRDQSSEFINSLDNDGNTPLMIALQDNTEILLSDQFVAKLLSLDQIDVTTVNKKGENSILLACKFAKNFAVGVLLGINSSPEFINNTDNTGSFPLQISFVDGYMYGINMLLRVKGVKLNKNFLYLSAGFKGTDILDLIFSKLSAPEFVEYTENSVTPLMRACGNINELFVKRLLALPFIKVAVQDSNGETALHYISRACTKTVSDSALNIINALIERNPALTEIKNKAGQGPGNPFIAGKGVVRITIKSRKKGLFRKHRNTNKNIRISTA